VVRTSTREPDACLRRWIVRITPFVAALIDSQALPNLCISSSAVSGAAARKTRTSSIAYEEP
jgi:hypothetical protein